MLQTKVKKKNVQDYLPSKVPLAMSTQMEHGCLDHPSDCDCGVRSQRKPANCSLLAGEMLGPNQSGVN